MKKLMLIAAGVAATSFAGYSSQAATATGTAYAEIVAALTVTSTQNLDFGRIVQPTVGQTVVVSNVGAVSGATAGHLGGQQQGTFTLAGNASTNVTISIADTTLTGPGTPMALSTYTFSSASPVTLDAGSAWELEFSLKLTH